MFSLSKDGTIFLGLKAFFNKHWNCWNMFNDETFEDSLEIEVMCVKIFGFNEKLTVALNSNLKQDGFTLFWTFLLVRDGLTAFSKISTKNPPSAAFIYFKNDSNPRKCFQNLYQKGVTSKKYFRKSQKRKFSPDSCKCKQITRRVQLFLEACVMQS